MAKHPKHGKSLTFGTSLFPSYVQSIDDKFAKAGNWLYALKGMYSFLIRNEHGIKL